jgi:hypothetical protein
MPREERNASAKGKSDLDRYALVPSVASTAFAAARPNIVVSLLTITSEKPISR